MVIAAVELLDFQDVECIHLHLDLAIGSWLSVSSQDKSQPAVGKSQSVYCQETHHWEWQIQTKQCILLEVDRGKLKWWNIRALSVFALCPHLWDNWNHCAAQYILVWGCITCRAGLHLGLAVARTCNGQKQQKPPAVSVLQAPCAGNIAPYAIFSQDLFLLQSPCYAFITSLNCLVIPYDSDPRWIMHASHIWLSSLSPSLLSRRQASNVQIQWMWSDFCCSEDV